MTRPGRTRSPRSPVHPARSRPTSAPPPSTRPRSSPRPSPAACGDPDPPPSREGVKRVLIFMNEVAGGRKLLSRPPASWPTPAPTTSRWSRPRTSPRSASWSTADELREAAQSRVDVTQAVLAEFGIESEGAVMDPDPVAGAGRRRPRHQARLRPALGPLRDPLRARRARTWSSGPRTTSRPASSTSRSASTTTRCAGTSTHTLVVATKTVNSKDLIERLKERAKEKPHRYTFICPRSGDVPPRGGLRRTSPRRSPRCTATRSTPPASR